MQIAQANGYYKEQKEGIVRREKEVIDVVQGMVEELDLKYDRVDVIVSEWMGYCLLFESMLNSVIYARDRWLKPGGAILPDIAKMVCFWGIPQCLGDLPKYPQIKSNFSLLNRIYP